VNDIYIITPCHIDINFLSVSAFVQNRIYISHVRARIFTSSRHLSIPLYINYSPENFYSIF